MGLFNFGKKRSAGQSPASFLPPVISKSNQTTGLNAAAPSSHALLDFQNVYPYVVPEGYVKHASAGPEGFLPPLGHGVFAMLVQDLQGVCGNIRPDELDRLGFSPAEAHGRALANLEALAEGSQVQKAMHRGPDGLVFMRWFGHWLAASCIRLPGLHAFCRKNLNADILCASIPQRESMLIFPFGTREQRDQMRSTIRNAESDARKLVTWELFTLTEDGLQPLHEPQ